MTVRVARCKFSKGPNAVLAEAKKEATLKTRVEKRSNRVLAYVVAKILLFCT